MKRTILSIVALGAAWLMSACAGDVKVERLEEVPEVFRIGAHSHTCRSTDFSQEYVESRLHQWAEENEVDAMGLGSPWTAVNARTAYYEEHEGRDRYYAGQPAAADSAFDRADVEAMMARVNNALGNRTLYYPDNETPKQRYGHLWYVGFSLQVPNWHDYDQGLTAWYTDYDDAEADVNALTGEPQRRRTYREVVDEQRAAGALCIWAHPTSWWTTDGDPNGPFTTNIAAEMLPQLMEDGYLDGMTVVGYDAYHRDYEGLWFALLDRGYRVPAFAELDISFGHNIESDDCSYFNILPRTGQPTLTEDWIKEEFRAAHHTASSGPVLFLTVDGERQGAELTSAEGKRHRVTVEAYPAKGETRLSKVELVGRGGEVLVTVRDFEGGRITWTLKGTAEGGYLVARCFGEHDGDYAYKAQQCVRHCAITNPVWLRTPAFQAPEPIATTTDHMANAKVRELMDYLAKGYFRKDYPGCMPGIVPVAAWRMDEMARALREEGL